MTDNCYHHPYPAVAVCETCRRPLCSVCVRWQRGYAFCEHDLPAALPEEATPAETTAGEEGASFIVDYYGPIQATAPLQEPAPPPASQPPTAPETADEGGDTDEDKKYRRSMRWYENP